MLFVILTLALGGSSDDCRDYAKVFCAKAMECGAYRPPLNACSEAVFSELKNSREYCWRAANRVVTQDCREFMGD